MVDVPIDYILYDKKNLEHSDWRNNYVYNQFIDTL